MPAGFVRVPARELQECNLSYPSALQWPNGSNESLQIRIQLQRIGCLLFGLHGGLQRIRIRKQHLHEKEQRRAQPQVKEVHFDSIYPVFKVMENLARTMSLTLILTHTQTPNPNCTKFTQV